jgi:adenylate cyclase
MALFDDLKKQTEDIAYSKWTKRDGQGVPKTEDIELGNDGVDIEATFLYADLADSTQLAITSQQITAEVCKAYLMGTTRIIRALGGEIRSFDGDRVMGVFYEGAKNTAAAEAGLKINYFFGEILVPAFKSVYAQRFAAGLTLKQTVGIDTSKVLVIRSGIRNNNDLVWVGRAPNIAAKLSGIRDGHPTYITKAVFDVMTDGSKYGGNPRQLMWEACTWNAGKEFGVPDLYRSTWHWKP